MAPARSDPRPLSRCSCAWFCCWPRWRLSSLVMDCAAAVPSKSAAALGLDLEDLDVRPTTRGKGYGKALLAHLARAAVKAGASRIEWSVLTWNKPSIEFYELVGARQPDDWFIYRLADDALKALAN